MGKKYLLTFFILLLSFYGAFSQVEKDIIPPSPRTADFNKFIDFNVSIENGLPDIKIPLHEVKIDGISIPILLSYHASGITYGQTNGDAGLGWSLTPGYRVSRTIFGRPDEFYTMPDLEQISPGVDINQYLNSFATKLERDTYLSRFLKVQPGSSVPYLLSSSSNYLDGQYDQFTYSLLGSDGHFVISDKLNKVVTKLSTSPTKISYDVNDDGIREFNIKDGNGLNYKFSGNVENSNNLQVYFNGQYRKYSTSWMLSELNTPFGNTVFFNYEPFQETSAGIPSASRTLRFGASYSHSYSNPCEPALNQADLVGCYPLLDQTSVSQQGNPNVYNTRILSEINSMQEHVQIGRNSNGTISHIHIDDINGNRLKAIEFYYSNFYGKVFLDSLIISDKDGQQGQKYIFDYNDKNQNWLYFDCFGYYQNDPGAVSNGEFAPEIQFLYDKNNISFHPLDGIPYCTKILNEQYSFGKDKRVLPTTPIYTLSKITYPTGGYSSYTYESNAYSNGTKMVEGGGLRIKKIIHGTNQNNSSENRTIERSYVYGNDGYGSMLFDPTEINYYVNEYVELVPELSSPTQTISIKALRKIHHSSDLTDELNGSYLRQNYGWYPHVKELFSEGTNGYIDYTFIRPNNGSSQVVDYFPMNQSYLFDNNNFTAPNFSYFIPSYDYWSKSFLKKKEVYEGSGSNYVLKSKEEFEYFLPSVSPSDELLNLKVTPFALRGVFQTSSGFPCYPSPQVYDPYEHTNIHSLFNYSVYKITKADVLLRKKIITLYEHGNESEEVLEYDYNGYNLVSSETRSSSKEENIVSQFKYPFSYNSLSGNDEKTLGIKRLNELNALNFIVEKSIKKQNTSNNTYVLRSSSFFEYHSVFPLVSRLFEIESNFPLPDFIESNSSNGSIQIDPRYVVKANYYFGEKGNLVEQAKEGDIKESFIWSHHHLYPIAKVLNADKKDIFYTSFEDSEGNSTDGDAKAGKKSRVGGYTKLLNGISNGSYKFTYWERISGNNNWIFRSNRVSINNNSYAIIVNNQVDDIRFYPESSSMYSYTYDPFLLLTSQCDNNDKFTYYEYDGFSRLVLLKDENNNILKQFCYNYSGQIIDCEAKTIYAKVVPENLTYSTNYLYGDVVLKFYADDACTIPLVVNNLTVNLLIDYYSFGYDFHEFSFFSETCNGSSVTILQQTLLVYYSPDTGFSNSYSIRVGEGYQISSSSIWPNL